MDYPISLDTALAIVGSMKVKKIKEIKAISNTAERENTLAEIDMYIMEEKILYDSDNALKSSIIDKVIRLYSPLLKKENEQIN